MDVVSIAHSRSRMGCSKDSPRVPTGTFTAQRNKENGGGPKR
jgi:hypothetical protein